MHKINKDRRFFNSQFYNRVVVDNQNLETLSILPKISVFLHDEILQ